MATVPPIHAESSDAATPALYGGSTDLKPGTQGAGVEGASMLGPGVHGHSQSGRGVIAESVNDYGLRAHSDNLSGIRSSSKNGTAIEGATTAAGGIGIDGGSPGGIAVRGSSPQGVGVSGISNSGIGVLGESTLFEGVRGIAHNRDHGAVVGKHVAGGIAVYGESTGGTAIHGQSDVGEAVHAQTNSPSTAALAAYQLNANSTAAAIYASHAGHGPAGFFQGSIVVTGDISLTNADCAEDFTVAAGSSADPGTVMVLEDEYTVRESNRPYDTRVAGIVSGAGPFKPGIVLDKRASDLNRKPLALMGKVYCKADAGFGGIKVGDLLTTSATPGHAMRAADPLQAFGAVIGKALAALDHGTGMIPVLVSLQ